MTTRFVLHAEALDQIDARPLLNHLAEDVANDMRRIVPVDTGALLHGIHVAESVDGDAIRVVSSRHVTRVSPNARRTARYFSGKIDPDDPKVPFYVEYGTRHMRAQPYMRPALYRYRPGP